jgi:hypothetical protein
MAEADHPLDLAKELLAICERIGGDFDELSGSLGRIVERLRSPDLPNEARELTFRIYEVHRGDRCLVAVANNALAAKAAFGVYVTLYPTREWMVRWGMNTPAHHVPKPGLAYDPVPPRTIG